ncbi:Rv1355c family protein [Mycobacterium sp. SMC-4]|uniref:Rv1355c family protein n=1 Tax=Mycobacterium sp. SMC-4 TaxID=2857059 RepID=UPI0021B46D5B|nr:Rv1355c family protein [Mycobacterium sp. SMC-4]UXA19602.1 Rv1355c family protein [Mycobacterium sp. SMC-4]
MTSDHSDIGSPPPPGHVENASRAVILDPQRDDDARTIASLRADPQIVVFDSTDQQAATLAGLLPAPDDDLTREHRRWAYYPWRRALVGVLGPRGYARTRTDRNRNLITLAEHHRLSSLRVGVVGLSVGHAIAHTLAMQALCGHLRLADYDDLELSNLNRVPATVFDLGVNKAVTAARRIAEVDPYFDVEVLDAGLTEDNLGAFLDGLDVVVEECDSLDVKALVRQGARTRGIPVLMASSDRGLIDVERFDVESGRPLFHGLLGDVDVATLSTLDGRQKIPHVLRILDAASLSPRGAASLVEVGQSLATWPQLVGDVLVGASAVAEAVRRIGLGEPLTSGRVRIDVATAMSTLTDPAATAARPEDPPSVQPPPTPRSATHAVALAAHRAPSGGNAQPWHIDATEQAVTIRLAPEYSSTLDIGLRGSAVALGAAVFNARVAAAAHGLLGPVRFAEDHRDPLLAEVALAPGDDAYLAGLYPAVDARETNRHRGTAQMLSEEVAEALRAAAHREGVSVELLSKPSDLQVAGQLLGAADRIRYLTPVLHADMASEMRWPGDQPADSGIDVYSLELPPDELATLDILRRTDVMTVLAQWDAGTVLGSDTGSRIAQCSALAVLTVDDRSLTGYARGGCGAEALWLTAQQLGLAVQPISPAFLYAHDDSELTALSPTFAAELIELRSRFRLMTATPPEHAQVLLLRLTTAPPTSVRSRRRTLDFGSAAVF